jgi:oligopeptide transport system substrate-binding protein
MQKLRMNVWWILVALASCTGGLSGNDGRKTLRLSFSDDVKTADPAIANDTLSAELIGNIFEGLLRFSYLGPAGQIEPALAQSLPVIKDQDKTLIFHLKQGVLFQNSACFPNNRGRELTAADFVYSFKRIGDPQNRSPNWWLFDGMVVGFNEWKTKLEKASPAERQAVFDEPVVGLESSGKYNLTIRLTKPFPQFLYILAMNQTSAVARECVEKFKEEIGFNPVGTGPFQLNEWRRGSKIILRRNKTFREDLYPGVGTDQERDEGLLQAAGSPMPFADEVQWEIIKEDQPRWLKFLSGGLDLSLIPTDNFNEVIGAGGDLKTEYKEKGYKLRKDLSLTSWWIEFNNRDPILGKNKKLRMALAHAFNRARALELLFNNRGILASGPITPTLEGGENVPANPFDYDLEKAKKLLAEAGYPEGKNLPALKYEMRGPGTLQRQLGELLQENFAKIGVKIEVGSNSFPEAITKAKEGRFQIMLGGWAADYPDAENFLQVFYSKNQSPGPNSAAFNNSEFDHLYEKIRMLRPSRDRSAAILRMNHLLQEEVPLVFFFHSMTYTLYRSWLNNFKRNEYLYGHTRYYDLDLDMRKKLLKAR